jgi:hypothetical protein
MRVRVRTAAVCVWAVWAALGAGAARGAEALPQVTNLGELLSQPPVHLASDWEVRVGWADPGEQAGPWVLVYADVRYRGQERPGAMRVDGSFTGQLLGPVAVEATWDGAKVAGDQVRMVGPALENGVYCVAVPLTRKGTCHIAVKELGGAELMGRDVTVATEPVVYWQPFAELYRDGERQGTRVRKQASAAVPVYSGISPVFDTRQAEARPERPGAETAFLREGLPGTVPMSAVWLTGRAEGRGAGQTVAPLKLSLEEGKWVMTAAGVKMVDWPDELVLARWWVNGKPVVSPRGRGEARGSGRQVVASERLTVEFGLPASLGEVKVGDKVTVQVLYVPGGMAEVSAGETLRQGRMQGMGGLPLLSNPVEFEVTAGMVGAK